MSQDSDFGLITVLKMHYHAAHQMLKEAWDMPEIEKDMDIVYLDQKQWIQLSEQRRGNTSDPEIAEVLELIERTSSAGKAVYPLSIIHLIETASRSDDDSRMDLLDLMCDISNLYTISPATDIERKEVELFVEREQEKDPDVRNQIFQRGIAHSILGKDENAFQNLNELDEDRADLVRALMRSKYGFKLVFGHQSMLPKLSDRSYELELKEFADQRLFNYDDLDPDEYKRFMRRNMVGYFNDNIRPLINQVCDTRGVAVSIPNVGEMRSWIRGDDNEIGEFLRQFPMMYIHLTLTFSRNVELEGTIDRNDLNDLMSLSPAIAYSDIVLTEQDWTRRYFTSNLNQDFDTIVRDDLLKLPEHLD
ncbi:hypothetical protein [Halococcus saccharolyticus]|uniref:Uncharacterized protein n=1 Tax=Halococcus saccharolyticus DSM 5350 TaxID=1227455 RepID=M0MMT9_9EURY|nr:hypothetical protein [Halococcus saccharolyticus]EMA46039.1 hypothetical protein C449_05022 [Halococcus saccharolyticus DSM 5350]